MKHPALTAVFSSIVCVDYPGRASRSDEEPIEQIAPLVENILHQYDCFHQNTKEPMVLFGHSFGAIVAFEVARRLEEEGRLKAVFVSASAPPSKTPLVETAVSKLSAEGICEYFASKGNPVNEAIRSTPELLSLFIQNVKVDYTSLETYPGSHARLKTPLFVIGGGLDPGVSLADLENWGKHVFVDEDEKNQEEKKEEAPICTTVVHVPTKVYPDQGHFYLNDEAVRSDLCEFISQTVAALGSTEVDATEKDLEEEAEVKEHVRTAFIKALGDLAGGPDAHFFNELGGTSLDTMVLTAHLQGTVGLRITQNEIILHPTLNSLAERIMELKKLSTNAPTLDPIETEDGEWYPASAGQEQMVALWETAPIMYNMPTTIEFHGHIDNDLLQKAMEHVTKQQEGLRTVVHFDMMTQKVMQMVLPVDQARECFAFVVIAAIDEDDARRIIERESGFVFILSKPPVFRAVLVKTPTKCFLLLNQHHVGADGWSRTQYRSQILKAYLALSRAEEPEVIPRHPSYIDWTMYTRRLLFDHGQKAKQLAYWRDKLQDLPVLDLPLDHVRPLVLSSRGARIPVTISANLTSKFSSLMAKANSNLFVGLLSLYMSLLHAWGGGEKFSIGVAMANRQHEGLDKLVGYMANEVAIVGDFSKDPTFVDFLSQIRKNVLEAMGNADVPFHEVCEEIKVERSSSRTSVFQAMFALQEREWHSLDDISPKREEDGVSFNLKQYNHNTSKFEVHLQLRHDKNGGLEGDFHVATDLFLVETGERMIEAFIKLMEACIDEPELAVTEHDITPRNDREIIDRVNSTGVVFNGNESLWDRIESISGDKTAFKIHEDEVKDVPYDEFREKSKKVAHFLASHRDVSAQTQCVGILVRNSAEGIMMILGTYLAGMTCVILDIDKTPINRIEMIFQDANVRTVLVVDKENDVVGSLVDDFSIFTWAEALDQDLPTEANLICPRNEDHPFAIYYTSGTTGLPKGVVIELRNVTNLWNWWLDYFSLCQDDRCMLFSSLSFIMSIRQWLPPLMVGASVAIPRNALEFESAIVGCRVNKLVCTPSALAALDIEKVDKQIQEIQVAGEPPQKKTLELWSKVVEKLHIGLGPTELCAHALCGQFDGDKISIGLPAANVRAYVVNKHGNQMPINCVGELWIAGANVANGYLNRDAENTKHFSTDKFVGDGYRLYKTGDLCKRLVDGRIQFIGRRDKQIKLNGYRIEIGDIQNAMPPTVKNSLVMIHNGQLIAFVMPEVEPHSVKSALEDKLPTYMVPSRTVSVREFPLNKNRKVDTGSLLKLVQNDTVLSDENESSANESQVEKVMKMVWSEVLGVDAAELKRSDNFFSRGGTSLTAVIMARKLGEQLCTDVSVHDVFRYQTIASFSEHLESVTDQIIDGIPTPLLFLKGGYHVIDRNIFAVLQILGLIVMTIIVAVPLIATTFVSVRSIIWFGLPGILLFPLFVMAGCLVHMGLVLAVKWGIMGRFREGKAKTFSWYFLKWWLVRRVIHVSSLYSWVFDETPLSSLWLKLLGAKIGSGCSIEQAYVLEPDLVTIGNDCVLEFEAQLSTSEIKGGVLEFRRVTIGDNVKLGVRSVLLGGTNVPNNCEVLPKAALDWTTSPKTSNVVLGGSPAKVVGKCSGEAWRLKLSRGFMCCQLVGVLLVLFLMALIAFVGVSIGIVLSDNYGPIALIAYLGAVFPTMSSVILLLLIAALYRAILPKLQPGKVYSDEFFLWRKWIMDRLFLSPLFTYASERTLQTSSTFPWYLKLLGAEVGAKAWMNHPYIRVGVNFLDIGAEIHMGMLSYMTTARVDGNGVSFHPIYLGDHVSFGQRCVMMSGSSVGCKSTVGAETMIPQDFELNGGETTFGSQAVKFSSSMSHTERVLQTQQASQMVLAASKTGKQVSMLELSNEETSESNEKKISRRQDVGNEMFWTYVFVMLTLQALIPIAIGASYAVLYWAATIAIPDLSFQMIILISPLLYIMGSFVLMIILRLMQGLGGGFTVGTSNFFSIKFLYWHLLADMIYFCTSTVLYPMSGTFIYCAWLRFMGAKVGKSVFISPENGGFREIDFMNIGDNCVLMTPNIHAHYTDHGQLQFCSIILEDNVEINFGATIMPLTQYQEGCRLRPHAVTVKGQICEKGKEYFGNPCKADMAVASLEYAALLFPGQGSQYYGMIDKLKHLSYVQELLTTAKEVLGWDVLERSSVGADDIENTLYAQPLMFVAGLAHAEWMKRTHPTIFTRVKAVAGFSLGEITALCFSGAITLVDGLKLVKARAEAMSACNGGRMCNVRGLSMEEVTKFCQNSGCTIANIICNHEEKDLVKYNIFVCAGTSHGIGILVDSVNSSSTRLVSASAHDVEETFDIRTEGKAKKLRVSGAFHSKHMARAQKRLVQVFDSLQMTLPTDKLIYSNVTGRPYKSVEEIRQNLKKHIVSPVLWHSTIQSLIEEEGVSTFLECGPMTVLSKTVEAIVKDGSDEECQQSRFTILQSDS